MNKMLVLICFSFLVCALLFGKDKKEAETKVDFEKEIWPMVKRSCIKCHREPYMKNGRMKKPKGELILTSKKGFLKGGEEGEIIVSGKPEKSSFYSLTILSEDDDDIMPAKGDPLSKEETALIKKWISQGADFGTWIAKKEEKKKDAEEKK